MTRPFGTISRATWFAFATYLAISSVLTLSWWRGLSPFPFLGSDAGNIAGYAAAWADREAFSGDPVLGDVNNFRFYATAHIPALIALRWVVGDFGGAFLVLLLATMLVQAWGFYRLGKLLFENRLGAWLLGVLSFGTVSLTIDYWGTYHDAQPRFVYAAILPYLLAAAIRRANQPLAWPGLFLAHGLASYVHPVSGPSVALATWLMLLARGPRGLSPPAWIAQLIKAGAIYSLVFLPFAVNYLMGREFGRTADFESMMATYIDLLEAVHIDGMLYVRTIMTAWQAWLLLPAWGLAGAAAVWRLAPEKRGQLGLLALWLAGIVAASLGVTLVEQAVARALRVLPPEIDTIRNVRYVFPVLIVWGLWGTLLFAGRVFSGRGAAMAATLVALAWFAANKPGVLPTRATLACLGQGRLLCPPADWVDRGQVLEWLKRNIPRGTKVLPALDRHERSLDVGVAVRYHARLPVAFSYKDGGTTLGYANDAALSQWKNTARRLESAWAARDLGAILSLAGELDAAVVLLDFVPAPLLPEPWRIVLTRGNYVVLARSAM